MTDPAHVHALVFGLERYAYGSAMDLPGSARDAVRFAHWVLANGVPAGQVWVGLSRLDEQEPESAPPERVRQVGTTRDAVRQVFTEELTKHHGELLLVFWSGHGMVTTDRDRVLFTSDATPTSRLNVAVENLLTHLASSAVNFARTIVIIDGCATYLWTQGLSGKLPTETWDIADDRPRRQTQDVLLAAAQGQAAVTNHTERYGEFAKAVLDTLAPRDAQLMGLPPDLDAVWVAVQAAMASLRASGRTRQTPLRFERQHNLELTASATTGDHSAPSCLGRGSPAEHSIERLMAHYDMFAGRARQLAELDHFLTDDTARQLLVWEPTGRGKTALLIRWVQMLAQRDDLTVVFLPISHRAKTDTSDVALPHLAMGLAYAHGEVLTADQVAHPDRLRSLIIPELISRAPSPSTPLVVVIDGLDETTGWEVDAQLFPARLPERVKIVAAAKATADTTRDQLLRQLGWEHHPTANISPLEGLADGNIADMLATRNIAANHPEVAELTERIARVSQRDPLSVRMITDDLAIGRITLHDLHKLPSGPDAYFEHSLRDILEHSADSNAVAAIMGLCATAFGPLNTDDLATLDPERLGCAAVQATAIREVRRYLYGNPADGYTMQHPYLREMYLNTLLDQERDRLAAQFADWGIHSLGHNIEGIPAYLVRYWIEHLAAAQRWSTITEVCLEPDPTTDGARPRWAVAQQLKSGNYSGYIADLGLVLEHARTTQDLLLGLRASLALGAVHSAAASLPAALPALLVQHGTLQGGWSPETAIAYIATMPNHRHRGESIIQLAPHVDGTAKNQLIVLAARLRDATAKAQALTSMANALNHDQLSEALTTVTGLNDTKEKVDALVSLSPHLDSRQLDEAVTAAICMERPLWRREALSGIAPYLDPGQLTEALSSVSVMTSSLKVDLIVKLAPHLDPNQLNDALAAATTLGGNEKVQLLIGLAPHLDPKQLNDALAAAATLTGQAKYELLVGLAPHLSHDQLISALAAATTNDDSRNETVRIYRAQTIIGLTPHMQNLLVTLTEAFFAAISMSGVGLKTRALVALAPDLDRDQLSQALEDISAIDDPEAKVDALVGLAPYLDRDQVSRVLADAIGIDDPGRQATRLVRGYPRWFSTLDRQQLAATLADASTIHAPATIEALVGLAPDLDHDQLSGALWAASTITSEAKAKAIVGLAPHLDGEQLSEALAATSTITSEAKAKAIAGLAPHLDGEQLSQALAAATTITGEAKVQALVDLAPYLDRHQLGRALAATSAIDAQEPKALLSLAPYLTGDQFNRALGLASAIDDPETKSRVLLGLAPFLDRDQLSKALTASISIANHRSRAKAVTGLAPRLDREQLSQALASTIAMTGDAAAQVGALVGLAPYLDHDQVSQALADASANHDLEAKVEALIGLAPYLDYGQLTQALSAAAGISNRRRAATVLVGLAPYLDHSQLEHGLSAIINDPWKRAASLADLTEFLDPSELSDPATDGKYDNSSNAIPNPERPAHSNQASDHTEASARAFVDTVSHLDQKSRVLATALAATSELTQPMLKAAALTVLALHLEGQRSGLAIALTIAASIEDAGAKASALRGLAPHLEPDQLDEALTAAVAIETPQAKAEALIGMAPYLDNNQLKEAIHAAQTIHESQTKALIRRTQAVIDLSPFIELPHAAVTETLVAATIFNNPTKRSRALAALGPHLDPRLLDQALAVATNIDDVVARASALAGLAPHLNEEQLTKALEAASKINHPDAKATVLTGLAPHLTLDQVGQAFAAATTRRGPVSNTKLLTRLAPHLPKPYANFTQALVWIASIDNCKNQATALTDIAPYLDLSQLSQALRLVTTMGDPKCQAQALTGLCRQLNGEQIEQALATAINIRNPKAKQVALTGLAPHLDRDQLTQALAAATAISNPQEKTKALVGLAPYLHGEQLIRGLKEVAVDDPSQRSAVLTELALTLQDPRAAITEALQAATKIENPETRAKALTGLAPHLTRPNPTITKALVWVASIANCEEQASALTDLAPHLDESQRSQALRLANTMLEPGCQAQALTGLYAQLDRHQIQEALEATIAMKDPMTKVKTLVTLVPHLDDPQIAIDVALRTAARIRGAKARSTALTLLAPHLRDARSPSSAVVGVLARSKSRWCKRAAEAFLASHSDRYQLHAALEAASHIHDPEAKVAALIGLAPYLNSHQLDQALSQTHASVIAINHPRIVAAALIGLAPHLNERQLNYALAAATALDHPESSGIRSGRLPFSALARNPIHLAKVEALVGLSVYLKDPQAALLEAHAAAIALSDRTARIEALVHLAPHLDEEQLEYAVATATAISDPIARIGALVSLAPHLDQDQLRHAVATASAVEDIEHTGLWDYMNVRSPSGAQVHIPTQIAKVEAMVALAAYLEDPETAISQARAVAVAIPEAAAKLKAHVHLAPYLNHDQLGQALKAVAETDDLKAKVKGLVGLAPHLDHKQLGKALATVPASGHLPQKRSSARDLLDARSAICESLTGLVPYLDQTQLRDAVAIFIDGVQADSGDGASLQAAKIPQLRAALNQEDVLEVLTAVARSGQSLVWEAIAQLAEWFPTNTNEPELQGVAHAIVRFGDCRW